jgi:hypothetical protein
MTEVLSSPITSLQNVDAVDTPVAHSIRLPTDVANKFEVQNVSSTIEELIAQKFTEDTHPKEEPFYFVDLGMVLKKYQQWIEQLPRVKPFYGSFRLLPVSDVYLSYKVQSKHRSGTNLSPCWSQL